MFSPLKFLTNAGKYMSLARNHSFTNQTDTKNTK